MWYVLTGLQKIRDLYGPCSGGGHYPGNRRLDAAIFVFLPVYVMIYGLKLLLVFLLVHIVIPACFAQKQKNVFSVGLGVQHGFIFAHSPEVENTKGSNPTGIEGILSWQRSDPSVWNLCNCFPRKGILLAYYDYDNAILGQSYTAAYFLEPVYRLGKRFFFSFKGAAGLSYLTNPFDTILNPGNRSYSTSVSGYLLFGLGLWLQLSEHWWLNASVNYQHESNGGLQQPNKGINWPTAGFALSYQLNPRPYYTGKRQKDKYWKKDGIRWDAGLFGIAKRIRDENGDSHRKPLIGTSFQGSKQVGTINALTLGAEIFTDAALRQQLKQDSVSASAVRAGLLFGHEFLLGRFLFSQRLGVYIFDRTPYFDRIYHRWGIHYRINEHWGAGLHLQAHRQVADFIDLRITYSWQRKGLRPKPVASLLSH